MACGVVSYQPCMGLPRRLVILGWEVGLWNLLCLGGNGFLCSAPSQIPLHWFEKGLSQVVRDCRMVSFYRDIWLGHTHLRLRFHMLFQVSHQQTTCIGSMRDSREGVWEWDLWWRRPFWAWVQEVLYQLLALLKGSHLFEGEDSWTWRHSPDGQRSVRSAYATLSVASVQ